MGDDKPRLLHRQSQHGYTERTAMAMREEPEAVPVEYQRELTREARIREGLETQLVWRQEKQKIEESLAELRLVARGPRTDRCVRNLERELAALGKAVAADALRS